jgi:hypothetical protein
MRAFRNQLRGLFSSTLLLSLCFVGTAQATLGETASSFESNRIVLKAVHKATTTQSGYTIQEDVSDAAAIRQYTSSSGVVFAVAWNGVSHPDLTSLLGSYYVEYSQALQKRTRIPGRRHVQIRGNRVVVEKWGHMRNLQGRAYVTGLLPSGVNLDEIR